MLARDALLFSRLNRNRIEFAALPVWADYMGGAHYAAKTPTANGGEGGAAGDDAQETTMQEMSASGQPARGARTKPGPARRTEQGAAGTDHGATQSDAYIRVALARLERDHVALLAALCELERAGKRRVAGGAQLSAPMRQALAILLRADLRQTQRALALAAEGLYGRCEDCFTPLSSVSLLTAPATTRCPACLEPADRARQGH